MNNFNHKTGDFVLYNYLGNEDEYIRGRIINIDEKEGKAKIEIGVCHRKSEDLYLDILNDVPLDELYPINMKL